MQPVPTGLTGLPAGFYRFTGRFDQFEFKSKFKSSRATGLPAGLIGLPTGLTGLPAGFTGLPVGLTGLNSNPNSKAPVQPVYRPV